MISAMSQVLPSGYTLTNRCVLIENCILIPQLTKPDVIKCRRLIALSQHRKSAFAGIFYSRSLFLLHVRLFLSEMKLRR